MSARSVIENTRRQIGNAPVSQAADRLDQLLRRGGFVYTIVGGYAVQHHGYVRFTVDVDAVVRERELVRQYLLATGEFRRVQGSAMTVVHRPTGVPVDLLPAGGLDSPSAEPYPDPARSGRGLQFVDLPGLIRLKLGAARAKDDADVVELIKVQRLELDFGDELPVHLYNRFDQLWRRAQAELRATA